jgi:hypothetical protein
MLTGHAGQTPLRHASPGAEITSASLGQFDAPTRARLGAAYGRLPLSFEANQGQAGSEVKFLSRGNAYNLFLTPTEAVLTLGNVDRGLRNLEQVTASLDGLAQTALSPLRIPHSVFRTPHSKIHTPHSAVLRMKLVGANPTAKITGVEELPGKVNYFLGNDPKLWRTNVPTYSKVKYQNVYPGIDLVYYGIQQQLEYDLVVAPGADPRSIRMSFEGADKLEVDRQTNLILHIAAGKLVQRAPTFYQEINGIRQTISGHYLLLKSEGAALSTDYTSSTSQQVGFEVGAYDSTRALVIDPVLVYSTYLGGSGGEFGTGIAADPAGNAYVTGQTNSADFPAANPFQPALSGSADAFVAKLNPAGTALVYSTYLGGSGDEVSRGIAVDSAGNAYVTGDTGSPDFPTANPLQPTIGGPPCGEVGCSVDAFVAKLNAAGTALVYSTYLGGSETDGGSGITLDSTGNAYVTGTTNSSDFPTKNPFQAAFNGFNDAFVAKLNAAGSALAYSTYLGGSGDDQSSSIAVDSTGNAYVTGSTGSPDFPTQDPLQPALGGGDCELPCPDAFVTKLNAAGSALVYSTYLGGSNADLGIGIALDLTGNAYVTGRTYSPDFPTQNPFQAALNGFIDAFVTKLNAAGSALVYSTYLGGSDLEFGFGVAVDSAGNTYVTGDTISPDFPTQNPLQPFHGGGFSDAFVTKLNPAGMSLLYSTYLGGSGGESGSGITVDSAGNAYMTGSTDSPDFPTKDPLQPALAGGGDAFVAKIAVALSAVHVDIDIKPGGSPNSINPRSKGHIPVAVLKTDSFDASTIDPSTVQFGRKGKEAAPLHSSLEDVDWDGDLDLVLQFETQATGIQCGDSSARLTGKTLDAQQLEGSDSIRTVGCH